MSDISNVSRPVNPVRVPEKRIAKPMTSIAFAQLPNEVIEQILRACSPDVFASLVLLNSKWRSVSEQSDIYAFQLLQCHKELLNSRVHDLRSTNQPLERFKQLFIQETKRSLFDVYLRPRETTISLVSISTGSSSAFPGGDAFHFSFSPTGSYVLAWSSSRIYIVNTLDTEIEVERELKILRRPVSVTILDDGTLLAVLSTDHQVDLYDLTINPPRHIRAVALDHAPRTIALSPGGVVLAAAYDGGVEVYSLSPDAAVTDRRAVKCDAADALFFSEDGTLLLGTTLLSKSPSTVVLTAPYFDPGDNRPEDTISQMWTTSIIFPNSSRDCSHAVLLPSSPDDEASWTFTYDRAFETFRAVRVDDLRNGTTYFTGPVGNLESSKKLLPSTLPATSRYGDLVSAAFLGKDIWIYGIPEDKSTPPETLSPTTDSEDGSTPGNMSRMNSISSIRSHAWPRGHSNGSRVPQWQLLLDRSRNTFVHGRKIGDLNGISAVKWINKGERGGCERLIAVAPGIAGTRMESDEDGIPPIDGGRLVIFDFSRSSSNGTKTHVTVEVGEKEPEGLEEELRDLETEVAIVRRRTVAQRRISHNEMLRSLDTASSSISSRASPISPASQTTLTPNSAISRGRLPSMDEGSEGSLSPRNEDSIMDMPYGHGAPRSGDTLRRAATAAAVNRRLNPTRIAPEHVDFRRADGREEHPHESDADNWVPPPPPYSRDARAALPEHLRNAVLAGTIPTANLYRSATQRTTNSAESDIMSSLQRSRSTHMPRSPNSRQISFAHGRTRSVSSITTSSTIGHASQQTLPIEVNDDSSSSEDIYDVSPVASPPPEPVQSVQENVSPLLEVSNPVSPSHLDVQDGTNEAQRASVDASPETMKASLSKPISPIPQPQPSLADQPSASSEDVFWVTPAPLVAPIRPMVHEETRRPSSSTFLTRSRLDAPVPLRPNVNHRMSDSAERITPINIWPEPSPPTVRVAITQSGSHAFPPGSLVDLPTSSASPPGTSETNMSSFSGPSASQLERLNSRSGRPNIRRPSNATGNSPYTVNPFNPAGYSPVQQHINVPARIAYAERQASSFSGQSSGTRSESPSVRGDRRSVGTGQPSYPQPLDQQFGNGHGFESRRHQFEPSRSQGPVGLTNDDLTGVSDTPSPHEFINRASSSTPNLSIRPKAVRLDTIHSVGSIGEIARRKSVARSIAGNLKGTQSIETKSRTSWMKGIKRRMEKKRDDGGEVYSRRTKDTKDTKCAVM